MKNKIPSLFQLFFWLILNFFGWLLLGCLASLIVAILMVAILGASGIVWLQDLIQQNYDYLSQISTDSSIGVINTALHKFNVYITAIKYHSVNTYKELGWNDISVNAHMGTYLKTTLAPYVEAVMLGTKLLVIRLYLLSQWMKLFLLLGVVGIVDGITQRHIRRANVGRESALIYHQSKALMMLSIVLGIFLDLALPIHIKQAQWILVIASIVFSLAIQITAKSFKKYL